MHRLTLAVAALAAFLGVWAQTPERLRLWEGDAPCALGSAPEDVPQITVYLPPERTDGRATSAVLICPGGGYRMLCDSYEGHDLAKWLVKRGVAGVVLTYRLAPKYDGRAIFADAKRAMRLVRTHAPDWRVDPTRIGAIGFSAGGHLAACLATLFDEGDPSATDPVERASCRPDFVGLVYPYLTMGAEYGHEHMRTHFLGKGYTPELVTRFSLDEQVTARTPPAFVAHARTDQVVDIAHSRRFVAAMKRAGRPVEYHELATGVHGLGAGQGPEWKQWTDAFAAYLAKQDDLAAHVNPYIGCSYNGHCNAAACYPFGLVQAGPDTGFLWWDYCSGYRYADTNILGFAQTHLSGTGCGDLGDLLVMPFTGDVDLTRTNFASAYRKETQTAQPGFYEVTLDKSRAKVSIAAAKHAAIYEIGYQGAETPRLFVDLQYGILNWTQKTPDGRVLACDVRQEGDRTLVGTLTTKVWVTRTYSFVLTFDHAITARQDLPKRAEKEKAPRFVLSFDLPAGGTLKAKVAISATDAAHAKSNLAAEIPHWDLARTRAEARAAWNAVLSRARAEGSDKELATWYTSLYHLFIQPNDLADAGMKPFFSTFSYWDTFRAAHPLYTLLLPEMVDDFVNSTLAQADRQGYMPVWTLWGADNHCMIGSHSIPVVVDAYLKGFRGFDAARAYAMIRKSLTENVPGRAFNRADVWAKHGYFPFDVVKYESVSRTLEHAYDDWCAARFAAALGRSDDAALFDARANNWTNVFDRSVGFARGRDSKGGWRVPFSPFKLNVGGRGEGPKDFTEGNSWQYTWHVMQDPEGLIAAMGGREAFLKNLNGLFSQPEQVAGMGFALDATGLIGQYAHGNEPSHHTAYFFQYGGRGDRTAEIVREVCDRFYRPEPEGLCGNDDCGQMSAWYLFSAMGFYPFNPCGGDYVVGAPQVPQVSIALPGGRTLVVRARNLSRANKYVRSVAFNGKPVDGFILKHADLVKGGELVFEMSAAQ